MKPKTLLPLIALLAAGCVSTPTAEPAYGIGTYEFWRPLVMVTVVLLVVALAFSRGGRRDSR